MPRDLPPEVISLFARQFGVATSAQLGARGLTSGRIATATRHGVLVQLHRGGYGLAERWDSASATSQHCLRLLCVQLAAPDAVGIACSAATAWGWPVSELPSLPIVARDLRSGQRLAGATVRRMAVDIHDAGHRQGLSLSSRERTVADVAAGSSFPDALITVDAALRAGLPCRDALDAARRLAVNQGRGSAVRAIEAGNPASESALESQSRGHIVLSDLPMPLCNVVIVVGSRWYRVDFLWVELGVVGEADGKSKYDDRERQDLTAAQVIWREKRRQEQIEEWGFRVARWGYAEIVADPAPMLRRLRHAIEVQQRVGFTWPADVRVAVAVQPGAEPPAHVVAQVRRLQRLGYPIDFSDERGRPLREPPAAHCMDPRDGI